MMHMTLYWSRYVTLLFDSWRTDSWPSYLLSLAVCFLVSAFYQYMEDRRLRFRSLASSSSSANAAASPPTVSFTSPLLPKAGASRLARSARLGAALLFGANSAISYILMLAIMSFNGGVLLAIVAGLTVGYYVSISSPSAPPSQFVPLPPSVEDAIRRICTDQNQPHPHALTRKKLASLGEEAALRVLRSTAATKIKCSIDGLISYLIENDAGSSPSPSSTKIARTSSNDQSPALNAMNPHPPPPPPPSSPSASPLQFMPLPPSVEGAIHQICTDQNQRSPNASTRKKLASLGEEAALRVLSSTAAVKIKWSIDGLISHFIEKDAGSSPSPSSTKIARTSLNDQSPARSLVMNSHGQ